MCIRDRVKAAAFRVLDHLEKLLASLDRRAADTLIDVAAGERPVRICGDVVLKIAFLVAETVDLLVFVGRNAGIVRHSKLGIEMCIRDRPQRAAAIGQAAVLYDGDVVVGGGTIVDVPKQAGK